MANVVRRASLILLLVVTMAGALAQDPTLPLAREALWQSALTWEARDRGDMAALALRKLAIARPGSTQVLLELGELYLRMNDVTSATQVLGQLQASHPDAAVTKTLETELRFATRDRARLGEIDVLLNNLRYDEAREQLDRLFPDGAPGGALSLDYYLLFARMKGGWEPAVRGLEALASANPGDPRYELALARVLLKSRTTAERGLRMLDSLAKRDDIRRANVDRALTSGFDDHAGAIPLKILDAYAERHPEDARVDVWRNAPPGTVRAAAPAEDPAAAAARRARLREQQTLLDRDALAQIEPQRQRINVDELQQSLRGRSDAASLRATTMLALLRGESVPEEDLVDDVMAAAEWAQRGRDAAGAGRYEYAAIATEAALAFRNGRHESVIPLATNMEALGETEASGNVLATAIRLDPDSTWLFETRIRWLINHSQPATALALLDRRPMDRRWTKQSMEKLRAQALDALAQSEAEAGDFAAATAHLEEAVALSPAYPWSRYRLAGLLRRSGDAESGTRLMNEGLQFAAGNPEMPYAQALYLSSLGEDAAAFRAVDAITPRDRSDSMTKLHRRLQVRLARQEAKNMNLRNHEVAVATVQRVEPLAVHSAELARDVAFGWIDIDEPARGVALIDARRRAAPDDADLQLAYAEVLDSADATAGLREALAGLHARSDLSAEQQDTVAKLQRSLDLREVRALERDGRLEEARRRLDASLAVTPDDRTLRIARADIDLTTGNPAAAAERYAVLVAENPGDLNTRLSYARALNESGDTQWAQRQLASVQEQAASDDIWVQLGIARRQRELGDVAGANQTLQRLIAVAPEHPEVLMAAGYSEREQRHFERAHEYFAAAGRTGDPGVMARAGDELDRLDLRLLSYMEAGTGMLYKPGQRGISHYESYAIPSLWHWALDYERRVVLRADAVSVDAGTLSSSFEDAALFGTVLLAGPDAPRRYV
ncbi:MAG TPA: tetratricopeptide repeat protein, partial [Povalibacter sp.]|nr:tetratricopeptide repeat protein [Povalibacter sp.]